jgi:hypothetical protein
MSHPDIWPRVTHQSRTDSEGSWQRVRWSMLTVSSCESPPQLQIGGIVTSMSMQNQGPGRGKAA